MSLLGIDVGTTGCKAAVFSTEGQLLASAYEEYDLQRPKPGYAELDPAHIWEIVKRVISQVASRSNKAEIQALSVSSLGEATVPVTRDRQVLGPSPLNFDLRGEEYLEKLGNVLTNEYLYKINGNTFGNQYSLTKLMWFQHHHPGLYQKTDKFLHWSGFISFMLGAEARVDYSLANRTLLFDLDHQTWSDELIRIAGLDRSKLPDPVPSGTYIGDVSAHLASELSLPRHVAIVSGCHDQCANAVGVGVIKEGQAIYGMGTYICITPVFHQRKDPGLMIARGLNTEHHAVPGLYVCYIYNLGGALLKWFRDTFAVSERLQAAGTGRDIYSDLIAEIPEQPSKVLVLPHFGSTGPPEFITDSYGVITGLRLETSRGEILKGILEGTTFYLKECLDSLSPTGISIQELRAAGGGSKSAAWLQICADILNKPFIRPRITEAGTLGAAILAGAGKGIFPNIEAGVESMVKLEQRFEPNLDMVNRYAERYEKYRVLWPLMKDYLRGL